MGIDPPAEQKPHDEGKVDFTCRPTVLTGADDHGGRTRVWVEVICDYHDETYLCGHHHRQWGPVSRCMANHVAISGTN